MSSFITLAKRPGGTEYEECWYLDDYFGHRLYGVKFFSDDKEYPADQCERIPKEEELYAIQQLEKEKARKSDPITEGFNKLYPPEPESFTQGQMDEYAMDSVETERKRIHGILSRVLVDENRAAIETGGLDDYLFSDYVDTLQEILDKVILGNKK